MPRLPRRSYPCLLLLLVLPPLTACSTGPKETLASAPAAYKHGDYYTAYNQARAVYGQTGSGPVAEESAYLAGLCAHRLPDYDAAQRYLWVAAHSDDHDLAGRAYAELGLVYMRLQVTDRAVAALDHSAGLLTGQDQANAYYNEGICLQRLGLWSQARAKLDQAYGASDDPDLRQQVRDQAQVTGFTIQLAAEPSEAGARGLAQQVAPASKRLGLGAPQITIVEAAGKRFYRVRIGEFGNQDLAERYRARLGVPGTAIMPLLGN